MPSLPRVGLLLSAFCICASILHAAPALVTTNADTPMVRFAAGEVRDLTKGTPLRLAPLPPVMRAILDAGGLVPYVKEHGDLVI